MSEMNLPAGWQLVGGLPVLEDGDWFVMAYGGNLMCHWRLLKAGIAVYGDASCDFSLFSPAHFAAAEKPLRDHQAQEAERGIKEVFRSEHVTVFRRERDGMEKIVCPLLNSTDKWHTRCALHNGLGKTFDTRAEAEAAAKQALITEGR